MTGHHLNCLPVPTATWRRDARTMKRLLRRYDTNYILQNRRHSQMETFDFLFLLRVTRFFFERL